MSETRDTEGTAASHDSPPLPDLPLSLPSPAHPAALAPATCEEDLSQQGVHDDLRKAQGQDSSSPPLDQSHDKSLVEEAASTNHSPRSKVRAEANFVDVSPATSRQVESQQSEAVVTSSHSPTSTDVPFTDIKTENLPKKSLPDNVQGSSKAENSPEQNLPEEDMGNRLGGEKSKGKKGERKDGKKEERREEKRKRQAKSGDKKKSKCPADPDSLTTTEIEDESSSFGFHSFENLLAGALGGSRSPKHRGGASQASARDEDERDEVEWVPMSIEDEGGVQFKPDADDSSTASQGYSTPLLATPLMKRSQPPRTTAERLDQLGHAIHDTILSNLSDVRVPQERDSMALLGRADSKDGSTDTLTLDDPASKTKAGAATAAAASASPSGDTDGKTSSGIPAHVRESRSNGSGSNTPVLRRRQDGSATNSPVLRRHNESSSPSTPVLRRRNEGSATNSPVLRQRGNQGSAPGTPVLKQRSEALAPRSPTLNQRHQASTAGSPPPVPPHQGSGTSSPVLRHQNGNSGPGSPSLRHKNKEPGTSSPVLPPRRQDSPSSPVPRRKHDTTATGSPILRLKSQNSAPGSPVLRTKVQGSGTNSPVLLRRQEGSAPGSPTLRRKPGSASNSPVLRPRHQVVGPSSLTQNSGTQSPSTDSGLSTPASEARPQGGKAATTAPQSQVSSHTMHTQPAEQPPPPTYPNNRPLPFPLDVDKLTDMPFKGAAVPCGMSHSLTRPATGPKEPLPLLECFHASLPRDSSRDSGLSLARAVPSGDEEWMEEMFYSCQDVSFEKELHEDVVDGEQFLQTPSSPHLALPPGDPLAASQARARGEKPKVVSQYDNVQDAEDAVTTAFVAVSSASITSSAAGLLVSGGGSKSVAGQPFGIKEQKPSQTTTATKQQGLQLSTNARQASTAAANPGRGAQETRRHHTILRQDGATFSVEPSQQAVAMEMASQAPFAATREPSQKEVTEHNLQLLVRAIEKLPHMDSTSTDPRYSLSIDDSLAEAEESSPTDSSFEEMGLRRVAKCVEVICAAEKKVEPTESATQPQVSTDLNSYAQGEEEKDPRRTSAAPQRATTSETQVSSREADTVSDKGEEGLGGREAFVPPPSPSAMAELTELAEEDEEDEEALERQEAAWQQQRALEARLFGDSVVKRLSSLLDSMEAEEDSEAPQIADQTSTCVFPVSSGHVVTNSGTSTITITNRAAVEIAAREVTLTKINLGEAARGNPRPTTLPSTVVSPGSDPAVKCQAREAVVFNVASVQASRVQSEIVLESSPCVSPTSKPKSTGSAADGERSKGAGNGTSSTTGTERQNSADKTQDAMQPNIALFSHAVPVDSNPLPAASERDVQGCNSVAVSEVKPDKTEGEKEKKKVEEIESPFPVPDTLSQAGVVKKPSIPDLLIKTAADEAASRTEEVQRQNASYSEHQHTHPDSNAGRAITVLFQVGGSLHPYSTVTQQHSHVRAGENEEEKEKETEDKDDEIGNHSGEEFEEGEATSPTTTVPKRESQQIHDVISAYWGEDETPTDTDSRTLSRSSLGSSELTGDSRSDTLSAGSRGDRLSVCTASTDSSFDDHVFTGMVFENRTYQGLQARPPGDDRPSHARPPAPGPTMEAAAIPSIVFENSARKERERPVKIPSLIFGNSSLRTEGALPGNHCRESSGNSSSEVEVDVEAEDEEEDDDNEREGDSQEENPSRQSSKRPSTSSVDSASALRVPALEETFCELQGVKTFLEELQDRTPTAERLPFFVGPEIHRPGGLGAVGGGESSSMWIRRSRMSPAVTERTESDLDASEHRDDISSTGESMYADDEDEGQDFFADDPGSEVMVSCGASYHSAPEAEGEGDGFWAECSTTEEAYQELETSMDAASTVFHNARRQMHDIHEHLQDLRRQMEMLQEDVQHARLKGSSEKDSSDFQPALE